MTAKMGPKWYQTIGFNLPLICWTLFVFILKGLHLLKLQKLVFSITLM
jgi:hypothetical protein